MKRMLVALAVAALAFPATATAKGPAGATITGPGAGGGIDIKSDLQPGSELMNLSERSGFFPAVFRQTPDPMLDARPKGKLGPKYTITYTVPGPNNETFTIKQDVYPYAKPIPVTYMAPGQEIFEEPSGTRGGWYVAEMALKDQLVEAGLPATPSSGGTADDGAAFSTGAILATIAAMALLLLASAFVLRRRARPAAA